MPFTPLIFVSFIPLFFLAEWGLNWGKWKFFGLLSLSLLLWNISTTWWVWYASSVGAVAMFVLNTLFMFLPFGIVRWMRLRRKNKSSWDLHWIFIAIWLLYEFAHHRWDLSWPWLCLGNSMSGMPWYIQWYEYTGTLGGSALILSINLLVFKSLLVFNRGLSSTIPLSLFSFGKSLFWPLGLMFGFGVLSILIASNAANKLASVKEEAIEVAVIQPNYDTYEEKFVLDPMQMVREMQQTTDTVSALTKRVFNNSLDCVLWPETSLVSNINVDYMESDQQVSFLRGSRKAGLNYLMGVNMLKWYPWQGKIGKPASAARQSNDPNYWYTLHNSALWLGDSLMYYHKSKLVPGTEQLPFVNAIPLLEQLAVSLDENSASGTLGKSDKPKALGNGVKVAPIICYESIYGDYVSGYVGDGAQWLAIVTNDAWWNNTPGHKQHFEFAKLRAIEQRKWVARSANTGISGFVDPMGNVVMQSHWYQGRKGRDACLEASNTEQKRLDVKARRGGMVITVGNQLAMVQRIAPNNEKTVYQRLGDLRILIVLCLLMLVLAWRNKNKLIFAK